MNGLVLALKDYENHTTDEGDQLQRGLEHAGWVLAGFRYGDGCVDVPTLLDRHRPDVVFVQDVRDWHEDSTSSFDKRSHFQNYHALRDCSAVVLTSLKDAGSVPPVQKRFFDEVQPHGFVTYYHEKSVRALLPWLPADAPLIRTYHSIDAALVRGLNLTRTRNRGIVTGATSPVYPLRQRVFHDARRLRIEALKHPGYGNRGSHTRSYLDMLTRYKTHVATASRYGFLLRKIIESIAAGAIPITDLPEYDVLPACDDLVCRVRSDIPFEKIKRAIDKREKEWNVERAIRYSRAACDFYDFRLLGLRLSKAIFDEVEALRSNGRVDTTSRLTKSGKRMRISAITTCVNYSRFLEKSISRWKSNVDDLLVVTSPEDTKTHQLCEREGVRVLKTDAFKKHGAAFNKSAAMDEGLLHLDPKDWCLFFDSDIIPPENWRDLLDQHDPSPGNLYGARRKLENEAKYVDGELAGFFQLWHVGDPVTQERPLLGSWHNCSGYDSQFMLRWKSEQRIILPIYMTHQGEPGANWLGVDHPDPRRGLKEMREERKKRGTYLHERLDRA